MKDAKGHGSDSSVSAGVTRRGNFIKGGSLHDVGISPYFNARPGMRPDNLDTQRTIASLRQQMVGSGAGHQYGLMQAIHNLGG